ncbi:MAG: endolytic transglycosylase MltG [Thermodesulfobacteriota bacterium]|nr:endolytic transglycosylase MltG [Thermodesulfobacteriota bacterium]
MAKRTTSKIPTPKQGDSVKLWRSVVWGGGTLLLFLAVPVVVFSVFMLRPCQITEPRQVIIVSGQPLVAVAHTLHQQQLISDPFFFRILAQARRLERQIQAGTYRFDGSYTPNQVLQILVAGRVELISCTFPEGVTALEIAKRCSASGLGTMQRYQQLMGDGEFRRQLHIGAASLEGYLFPETYHFAPGVNEETVLKTMVQQTRQHLSAELLRSAKKLELDELQLLTLASIIQKEAGNEEEMPLISAVFHNRLKRGMRLQADPTVIYGLDAFDGNLTRKHLRSNTPYNTYVNAGLPRGPIANPGLAALQAAVSPAPESYLYFVASGDGGHHFSRTLKEHNRAVRRYQLRR